MLLNEKNLKMSMIYHINIFFVMAAILESKQNDFGFMYRIVN